MQSSAELAPHRYREECNNLTYLVAKQKQLCRLSQNVLKVSQVREEGRDEGREEGRKGESEGRKGRSAVEGK